MLNARLAEEIARVALLRGTFTLRSGRTSNYYLDKYLFSTRPEILSRIGDLLAERIRLVEQQSGGPIDRLAGAELGGIPLVTVASLRTGLPSIFVRNAKKDYGTSKQAEGAIGPEERVVFIEDVATTGGQARRPSACSAPSALASSPSPSSIGRRARERGSRATACDSRACSPRPTWASTSSPTSPVLAPAPHPPARGNRGTGGRYPGLAGPGPGRSGVTSGSVTTDNTQAHQS